MVSDLKGQIVACRSEGVTVLIHYFTEISPLRGKQKAIWSFPITSKHSGSNKSLKMLCSTSSQVIRNSQFHCRRTIPKEVMGVDVLKACKGLN